MAFLFLRDKFRRDISALTSVQHEMIVGRDHGNHEMVRKTIASGKISSTNMHELCRYCQNHRGSSMKYTIRNTV